MKQSKDSEPEQILTNDQNLQIKKGSEISMPAMNTISIKSIFEIFTGIWGIKLCEHLLSQNSTAYKIWKRGLSDLTDKEIIKALDKLSCYLEFPPTLTQMRRSALDILPVREARENVTTNKWARLAWQSIPDSEKGMLTPEEVDIRFEAKYNNLIRKVLEVGSNV